MQVYHGTTHNFVKFDISKALKNNHVGAGIYFSTCLDDATENYSGYGPDLRNRVEQRVDDLMSENDDESESWSIRYERFKEIARKEMIGGGQYILTCEIKPTANLFFLGNKYIELYDYEYSEDGEDIISVIDTPLMEAIKYYIPDKCEAIIDDQVMKTYDIIKNILNKVDHEDSYEYNLICLILTRAGYDGVEYEDASQWFPSMVSYNTKHFVLYNTDFVEIIEREAV